MCFSEKYLGKISLKPTPMSNTDRDIEIFIREKYEKKYYMNSKAKEAEIKHSFTKDDYSRYNSQLDRLKDMGFTNEIHNLMLLKQFNGNMDAVAEVLITEGSQENKGKHKNAVIVIFE